MSSGQIPAKVVKELYAKSGNCCALGLSGEERKEIYIFAESLDYLMLGLGTNAHSNGNGISIPDYKENDLRVIREILKNLLVYQQVDF